MKSLPTPSSGEHPDGWPRAPDAPAPTPPAAPPALSSVEPPTPQGVELEPDTSPPADAAGLHRKRAAYHEKRRARLRLRASTTPLTTGAELPRSRVECVAEVRTPDRSQSKDVSVLSINGQLFNKDSELMDLRLDSGADITLISGDYYWLFPCHHKLKRGDCVQLIELSSINKKIDKSSMYCYSSLQRWVWCWRCVRRPTWSWACQFYSQEEN
jgi:hypothetical protein